MSNMKFTALASLAALAAPLAAQAEMVEMADTELADVNGQGLISNLIDVLTPGPGTPGGPGNPISYQDTNNDGIIDSVTYGYKPPVADKFIGTTIAGAIGSTAADGTEAAIGFHLLPFSGPISALGAFNGRIIDNSGAFGEGVADIAFMGPFRALDLVAQGKGTALDFLFFPISAPLDVAGNVFTNLNNSVVGTGTKILTAPINAVFGPVNRYVNGVTGRFEATVDGAAFAATEVKGALITNAFAGASAAAGNNGLNFTSRVFGRIAQAQAGLTANRLDSLAGKYGY